MCGIYLFIHKQASKEDLANTYRKMSEYLAHRGPDTMGVSAIPKPDMKFTSHNISKQRKTNDCEKFLPVDNSFFDNSKGFMGHHRLSIIDLEDEAMQPFYDKEKGIIVCFNGEIYNYIELRNELKSLNCQFKTESDTEVVLNSYLAWGSDCFKRFNGDFAVLIYDQRIHHIIGARDRLGVKPLYWSRGKDFFAFSSEIKGLLGIPECETKLNYKVAYQYLVSAFPTPETLQESFLSDTYSIPAGHFFHLNTHTLELKTSCYWSIEENSDSNFRNIKYGEAVEIFDQILKDSVRIRLRSDVPVSSFLSGGLDSPSIVWHAKQLIENISTFSSVFPNSMVDESEKIQLISQEWKLNSYIHDLCFDNLLEDIHDLVYMQDEPFSTLNVYSQYLNFKKAKQLGMKVILDGGGADEYLAGYRDYELLAAVDNSDKRYLSQSEQQRFKRFKNLTNESLAAWYNENERLIRTVDYLDPQFREDIQGCVDCIDRPLDSNYKGTFNGSYLKHALRHSVIDSWMNKSVQWDNRYLDRTGMKLGIEARVPFQDHRLIEFVLSLPIDYIYGNGFSKRILRDSMKLRLPYPILLDKTKIGFEFPFAELMQRSGKFRKFFFNIAFETDFREWSLIDSGKIIDQLKNIVAGKSNNYNVWRVFNLYLWAKYYCSN